MGKKKRLSRQDILRQTFDFTEGDLAENRQGRVSAEQLQNVWRRKQYRLKRTSFLIILSLIFFLNLLIVCLLYWNNFDNSEKGILSFATSILFMIFIIFAMESIAHYKALKKALTSQELKQIQGIVLVVLHAGIASASYLNIKGILFNLSHKKLRSIESLAPHIVYYLPAIGEIIAIEMIEE